MGKKNLFLKLILPLILGVLGFVGLMIAAIVQNENNGLAGYFGIGGVVLMIISCVMLIKSFPDLMAFEMDWRYKKSKLRRTVKVYIPGKLEDRLTNAGFILAKNFSKSENRRHYILKGEKDADYALTVGDLHDGEELGFSDDIDQEIDDLWDYIDDGKPICGIQIYAVDKITQNNIDEMIEKNVMVEMMSSVAGVSAPTSCGIVLLYDKSVKELCFPPKPKGLSKQKPVYKLMENLATEESANDSKIAEVTVNKKQVEHVIQDKRVSKKTKNSIDSKFYVGYIAAFVLFVLSAIIDNVITDNILKVIVMLLPIAFTIHGLLLSNSVEERISNCVISLGGGAVFIGLFAIGGKFSFIAVIVAIVLLIYALMSRLHLAYAKKGYASAKLYPVMPLFLAFVLLIRWRGFNFASEQYLLYALIPTVVLGVIVCAVVVPFSYKWIKELTSRTKKSEIVASFMLIPLAFYFFFGIFTTVYFNEFTSPEPTFSAYQVVDKNANGGRYTSYNLYVEIDGEKQRIDVSHDVYDGKSIGDEINIAYYQGGLNFPYYRYVKDDTTQK